MILFQRQIENKKLNPDDLLPSISIAVDIAYRNPRVYPIISTILSWLINSLKNDEEKKIVVQKILKRFSSLPNSNYMEIWLQRISFNYHKDWDYKDPLCNLVAGEKTNIWNNEWICSDVLKELMEPEKIVDRDNLKELSSVISRAEMDSIRSPD